MRFRKHIASFLCATILITTPSGGEIANGLGAPLAGVADSISHAIEWIGDKIGDAADNISSTLQESESDSKTPEKTLEETVEDKIQELADNEGEYATDSIILEKTTKKEAENVASKIKGSTLRLSPKEDYAVIYLPKGTSIDEVYENKNMKTLVPAMSPDYYVETGSITEDATGKQLIASKPDYDVSDSEYDMQQELSYVNMKDTWSVSKGKGMTVAIIDTGIDTDNSEFEGRISEYSYNASHDKVVKDYDMSVIEDEQGHGTAVAGTLAAGMDGKGIVGVAPEAELVVIKCDCDSSGTFLRGSDLVFGLAYAIERDVDVINMSFGTNVNIFEKYTELAVDSDIICVAAAGNEGSSIPSYPAADENVIGVGAMAGSDWEIAGYSNYGDNSELVAPGTVYTTNYKGGYKVENGTSLSAPIVAGAVALYLSGNKHTEYKDMLDLLKASSTDIGILGEDWTYGYGALDIHALVCEEKGTITYEMLTDEIENQTQVFVKGHTVQTMPEPERENIVLDGWYYDQECTDEVSYYEDVFDGDTTLYAKWINEDEGSAYTYTTLTDGTLEIRSYAGKRRYLTIPSEIEGKKVTSIGEDAFNGNTRLKSVILPSTLTKISGRAFFGCTSIRNISIPENVESIGANAFTACVRMSYVDIAQDGKLREINKEAFSECGITEFCIPSGLEKLGEGVFYKSTCMKSVEVADDNNYFMINNDALYDSSGETLLYYPAAKNGTYAVAAGTKKIDVAAFAFGRVTDVELPDGLEIIGVNGFTGSAITGIEFPQSTIFIGKNIFRCCMSLKTVTFSGDCKIALIPASAFENCCSLASISIPESVTKFDDSCFMASGLKSISFADNCKVSSIGNFVFAYTPLASIVIPQSVTKIDTYAFTYCTQLADVSFEGESSLDTISWSVFEGTIALSGIEIPDSVAQIECRAFYNSGLKKVYIGRNVSTIGDGALSSCQQLEAFEVNAQNTHFASYEDALYTADKSEILAYPAARKGTYKLADETKKIRQYVFCNAQGLTDVTYNEGLKQIDSYAFTGCESMVTPTLPSTLETIGPGAYEYCKSMTTKLIIPKSVITVGYLAFYNDYDLTDIQIESDSKMSRIGNSAFAYCGINNFTLPENVSTMGQEVFVGCKNLITVTFEADNMLTNLAAWTFEGADALRQITFEEGSKLQNVEARACQGMYALEEIDFRNCKELSKIGNYAFEQCPNLASVLLPSSVEEIGRYAFHMCKALSSLNVPKAVNRIGRYAFKGTDGINVYFQTSVLPTELEDNWNYDVSGYYMGVKDVIESGDWKYALTEDGLASVIKYMGSEGVIELNKIDGYEVVSVGSGAFKNNTTLTQITLPDTLTGIYQSSFEGTTNLESIVIPSGVIVIDDYAFKGSGIKSVSFGENSELSSIGRYSFAETANLTAVSLPDGVDKVKDYTFYKSGLSEIVFGEQSQVSLIGRNAFCKSKLTEVIIPSGVTKIDYYAFSETDNLKKVSLPEVNVLEIYGNAFYRSGLTAVSIPANVSYIGELCFAACTDLTAIDVDADNGNYTSIDGVLFNKSAKKLITCPAGKTGRYEVEESVTAFAFSAFEGSCLSEVVMSPETSLNTIGRRCFYNCDNLTAIDIPDGVLSIENYAFAYCDNLQTVNLSEDSQLGGIYKSAFYSCEKLESFLIPEKVQEISEYAFYGCTSMKQVDFVENSQLQEIRENAFAYSGMQEFIMPQKLLEIGESAFEGAELATLTFNECITNVGKSAFADCGLEDTKSLTIPPTVEFLGKGALKGADNIEELTIPFLGQYEDDREYDALAKLFGISRAYGTSFALHTVTVLGGTVVPEYAFAEWDSLVHVNLPSTIRIVGDGAFGFSGITSMVLPEGVVEIGNGAFEWTNSLATIYIPNSVKSIDNCAFMGTRNCSGLRVPISLKSLGQEAFKSSGLSGDVELSNEVAHIGYGAFSDCPGLESIKVSEENEQYASRDGVLYNKDFSELISAPGKKEGKLVLPESLKEIQQNALQGCSLLKEVEFNSQLEVIGSYSFSGCTTLEKVIIPDSVKVLSNGVFENCSSLTDVVIGNGVSALNDSLFYGCRSLKNITLGDAVEEIDKYVFLSCVSLQYLYLSKEIEMISGDAFSGCQNLQYLDVDEENKIYCSQDGILYNKACTEIIAVPKKIEGAITVPEGVKVIGDGAFDSCTELEKVVLPNTVHSIGSEAFRYCYALNEIEISGNITHLGNYALADTAYYNNKENWEDGVLYLKNCVVHINTEETPETLYVKEGITLIGEYGMSASGQGGSLRKVILPDSLEYIEKYSFSYNRELLGLYCGKKLACIGESALCGCDDLRTLEVPEGTEMADAAVFVCDNLEIVKVNDKIRNASFNRCKSIKTIALPYCEERLDYLLQNNVDSMSVIITSTDKMDKQFLAGKNAGNVFCYAEEGEWPDGWNHGAKAYYKGEWNLAEFYVNGMLVQMTPLKNNDVLQIPASLLVEKYMPEGAVFIGWDIDGDGHADTVPATLTEDITANAVFDTPITAISIDDTVEIEKGSSKPLKVSYTPKRNTGNEEIVWSSSDESVVTVAGNGTVTAISEGAATVTAKLSEDDSISASCEVKVIPTQYGIKLSQNNGTINAGEPMTIEPTYVFPEDDADVTEWSSSDDTIATVDNNGNITALNPGSVVITINHGTYSVEYSLEIKSPLKNASISDTECSLEVGDTKEIAVTLQPLDTTDSTDILWYSKKSSVAKVDSNGLVTAVGPGTTEIHAKIGGFDMVCTVTVTAPLKNIVLNTTTGTMRLDRTKPLNVIYFPANTTDDKTVTWSSSNDEVASVSDTGVVTAKKQGTAVITGTVGTHSATYSVTVIGLKDNETGITVTNSDDTVMNDDVSLDVDQMSQEDADTYYGSGWKLFLQKLYELIQKEEGHLPVTQVYDILLKDTNNDVVQPQKNVDVEIPVSKEAVTDGAVVYRLEEDGTITDMNAVYDEESGRYRFETEHFSVYVLGSRSIKKYISKIDFGSETVKVCPSKEEQLTITIHPSTADNTNVTWNSADETVATVSDTGVVKGLKEGETTITVEPDDGGGAVASCKVIIGHTEVTDSAVPATCTKTGLTEGKHCSACNEVLVKQEIVPALGHDYGEWETVKSPTCEDTGSKKRTCKVCGHVETSGVDAKGHEWSTEYTIDKKATCTEEGSKSIHCKNCKAVKNSQVISRLPKQIQKISVSKKASKTVTYKASALKKKKASFSISAKAKGRITYKVAKGAKYISVSKKGKVTIKKKTKKGTYKILITAAETSSHKRAKKYVVIKVK